MQIQPLVVVPDRLRTLGACASFDPLLEPFELKGADAAQPGREHLPRAGVRRGRDAEGPLPALPPREGARRRRAHHDRRLGRGRPGQPAGVRQPAALPGRDRAVAAAADRRRARGRRGGDVPGHPPRPPHQQLHRRLAAAWSTPRRCASRPTAASRRWPSPGTSTASSTTTSPPPSAAWRPGSTASSSQSYGHLLDGFLSPATNLRSDDLGGDLERRMAFPRRVIAAVRAAVGPDFVVGIRMSMDEDRADGLGRDEALRGAAALRRRRHRLPQRHQRAPSRATRPWRG